MARRCRQVPVAARSAVLCLRFKRVLQQQGYTAGKQLSEQLSQRGGSQSATLEPDQIGHVVHRVAGLPLINATCLPRSLTLYTLLRRAGYEPVLRIGAQPREQARQQQTQMAHAWVEVEGTAVAERVEPFVTFRSDRAETP